MDTQDHQSDRPAIRWGVVAFISFIGALGVLGPKLLWMHAGYAGVVRSWPYDAQFLVHPLMRMLLVLIAWAVLLRVRGSGQRLTMGLCVGWGRALKAFAIGFACTLPMLGLGLLSDGFTPNRYEVMYKAISPGITEEIFYRALLYGLLVQIARTPVMWTAIITGVVFGLAHIDLTPEEGQTILGQLNLWNALIGLGGFMYAWMFFESRWNLWLVIALHIWMNLWWEVFDLTSTPLGGFGATASRVAAVGIAVFFVVGLRVFGPGPGATIGHDGTTRHGG